MVGVRTNEHFKRQLVRLLNSLVLHLVDASKVKEERSDMSMISCFDSNAIAQALPSRHD